MLEVVGSPYYDMGHTQASVVFNGDGSVRSISGPNNEIYLKSDGVVGPEVLPEPIIATQWSVLLEM